MRTRLLLLLASLFVTVTARAHEVCWAGNPEGFPPSFPFIPPMTIYYRLSPLFKVFPPTAEFSVSPVRGETCEVEVEMDPPESQLLEIARLFPSPAEDVIDSVHLVALPPDKVETQITGRWRALKDQGPNCAATNWNEFVIPIDIVPAPPWKTSIDPVVQTFNIDTGGLNVGLRESCSLTAPSKIVGWGKNFSIDMRMRDGARFYSGITESRTHLSGTLINDAGVR